MHADSTANQRSSASVTVCYSVCVFVCPHDKTKTAETKIAKLSIGILHHESRYLSHQLILGRKVKGKGHGVTKCEDECPT